MPVRGVKLHSVHDQRLGKRLRLRCREWALRHWRRLPDVGSDLRYFDHDHNHINDNSNDHNDNDHNDNDHNDNDHTDHNDNDHNHDHGGNDHGGNDHNNDH